MRVLIVEDDPVLAANLGEYIEEQGDVADYAADGRIGLQLCQSLSYDAMILDLRLPHLDGIALCRRLRASHHLNLPVLMLTARDTVDDRIEGFEAGTDDYLVKPFSLREMYLRLCAIVRRRQSSDAGELQVGGLSLDIRRRIFRYRNECIELTPISSLVLEMLMRAAPDPVSRTDFEDRIWEGEPPRSSSALRGHVQHLRQLLEAITGQTVIHTVRGAGYCLLEIA